MRLINMGTKNPIPAPPVPLPAAAASGDQSPALRSPIPSANASDTHIADFLRPPRSTSAPEYKPARAPATPAPAFASPKASYRDPSERNSTIGQASVIPEAIQ